MSPFARLRRLACAQKRAHRPARGPRPRSLDGGAEPGQQRAARSWLWAALALVVVGGVSDSAYADASVVVELKRADGSLAEGTVRLSKGEAKLECTTRNGRCQLHNVPGGLYNVEVIQAGKGAAKPKSVMIPPAGEVKLIVAAQ